MKMYCVLKDFSDLTFTYLLRDASKIKKKDNLTTLSHYHWCENLSIKWVLSSLVKHLANLLSAWTNYFIFLWAVFPLINRICLLHTDSCSLHNKRLIQLRVHLQLLCDLYTTQIDALWGLVYCRADHFDELVLLSEQTHNLLSPSQPYVLHPLWFNDFPLGFFLNA